MKLIHYIARNGEVPGVHVNLADITSIADVMSRDYREYRYASFAITTKSSPEPTVIFGENLVQLQQEQTRQCGVWVAYLGTNSTTSNSNLHHSHRIGKGDNHAIIDLYEILYIGACMALGDGKYGFPIILRSTGQPINVSFDYESEASKAHVALDNAYEDYLNELNKQGV